MYRGGLTKQDIIAANAIIKNKAAQRLHVPTPPKQNVHTKNHKLQRAKKIRHALIAMLTGLTNDTIHECVYCGADIDSKDSSVYTIDHLVPLQNGGLNEIENVRQCCQPCNHEKGFLMPDEWLNILHKEFENTGSNNPELLYKIMRVQAIHRYVQRMGDKLFKKKI